MTFSLSRSAFAAGLTLALGGLLLTGCSAHAGGPLGQLQDLAAGCPDLPVNSLVLDDGSGSSVSPAISAERLAIIKKVAERTVVCGGQLTVQGFSSSSGATVTVFDDDVTLSAPTLNARLRQVPQAVKTVMAKINAAYQPALASLPGGGSDIVSSFRLMSEQAAQFPKYRTDDYLLTDGLANLGAVQVPGALTPKTAQALADRASIPKLPSRSAVTIAGLGHVSGDPVPSDVVEGMVTLYTDLCHKTGASTCLAVTDLMEVTP